jgi:hypothetical protein
MNLDVFRRTAGLATTFSGCKAPVIIGSVCARSMAGLTNAGRFGPSKDLSLPATEVDGFLGRVIPSPCFFESVLFNSGCGATGTDLVELDDCFCGGRGATRGDSNGTGTETGDGTGTEIEAGFFDSFGVGAARGDSKGSTGTAIWVGVFDSAGAATVVETPRPTPCGLGVGDGILLLSSELVLRPLVLDKDSARFILSVVLGEDGGPWERSLSAEYLVSVDERAECSTDVRGEGFRELVADEPRDEL